MDTTPRTAAALSTYLEGQKFGCVLAEIPWRLPERDAAGTMSLDDILALPVADHLEDRAHCYLWVPNALLPEGMKVLAAWGFKYTSNIIWQKSATDEAQVASDETDAFDDITEVLLFGIRGKNVRTLAPARSTVNFIAPGPVSVPGGKPLAQYRIIESCSWGPFLELFGHAPREGWTVWEDRAARVAISA
ncbi:MT-A70 family methyltransferase [Salipiger mangrovisoli]|uniref:S-adenosylmethionine-binding protein n=1 Tax=Salipiger mangrovisoli TaxID=2865933 RepID=A0ABR9X5G4_9RHOB|nr:MT-A70 family methyltransferase [Salipiger mangrovisoli]MBE9638703.1 S-adenosylmethionine-binding protein [Salipiger mangrovisoli]